MIKLLNYSGLELCPQCGRNCERSAFTIRTILNYTEFGTNRKSNPIEFDRIKKQGVEFNPPRKER